LLILVGVVLALSLRQSGPGDDALVQSGKPRQPEQKPPEPAPNPKKAETPPKGGVSEPKEVRLKFLKPLGAKETDAPFLMATIAPDARLTEHKAGDRVFLTDMKEFSVKGAWGNPTAYGKNGLVGDAQHSLIRVNGKTYPRGLGTPAPYTQYLRMCYALGKLGKSLHGGVALDDGKSPPWSIKKTTFVILGDGKVLWRSQGFSDQGIIEAFAVDVRGVAILELRVYTDYDGANASRAVWLDPYVIVGDGRSG
jgi:hypothetical protein